MKNKYSLKGKELIKVFFGSLIYVISVKYFIAPASLYSAGFTGSSQLINDLLHYLGFNNSINFTGYITFIMNIPCYFIAYRYISKKFFVETLISVIIQTIVMSMLPDPVSLILSDRLALLFVGALIAGFGAGLVLQGNGSCGGTDIVGVYTSLKWHLSPGNLNLIYNAVVYILCAIFLSVESAILSILYIVIFSFVMDKVYLQNIEVSLMVFTDKQEVKQMILSQFHRGVTYWQGAGAYTENKKEILMVVLSKYELSDMIKRIKEIDDKAFIITNNSLNVTGGYEKRLIL